ncbi:sulfatase-like hydrolase/transferase [Halomicroarcula sp. F28]|uniref:sulfatase n=1 Tax=Haloarcula salinisoli TaxID=2487746 RepID=UPI001C73512A|nr:sulfatase [Halomicroarcula salinisoli]MBX0285482.1 sulfatase-like hydrolase/transferase [Halomicroarcula salinisoli]
MDSANVLLITIDSLRADHTSCLAYEENVDPRLAELGERGATFRKAVSNGPNTTASFPSILTGAHSATYGPYGICGTDSPFLSRSLRNAGYTTFGYHSNPHLGTEQRYPTGFDQYNDVVEGGESAAAVASFKDKIAKRVPTNSLLYRLLRRAWHYFTMSTDNSSYARADTISDRAIDWLEQGRNDKPFFGWLHYMDVHYPFDPPEEIYADLPHSQISKKRRITLNAKMQERPDEMTDADVRDLLKLYDAEIRYTDSQIGRVVDTLEEQGVLDDTIVIVTADHGEAFGEHGSFGHHPYPYDELIRVPLFVSGPGVESTTVDQQVSLLDLAPTVLDLVGVETPTQMEGASFAPVLAGGTIDDRVAMTISDNATLYGCRTNDWKYITRWDGQESSLYDLQADPDEEIDVQDNHPEVANRFFEIISAYTERVDTDNEATIDHSPEVKQRLEDLGYVEE